MYVINIYLFYDCFILDEVVFYKYVIYDDYYFQFFVEFIVIFV